MRRDLLLGLVMASCTSGVSFRKAFLPFPFERRNLLARIRWLLEYPPQDGGTEVALAQQIVFGDTLHDATHGRWSDARLARTIRANILADYGASRIVTQNCWRISATEAHALELMRLQSA